MIAAVISGCASSPVRDYVNDKYPPADQEEQRQLALANLKSVLSEISSPGISSGLSLPYLAKKIKSDPSFPKEISDINISGENQLMKVSIDISAIISHDQWADNTALEDRYKNITFDIEANIEFSLTLITNSVTSENKDVINITVLPSFDGISLNSLKISDNHTELDLALVAKIIDFALNRYKDNISGYLSTLDIMTLSIPKQPLNEQNPTGIEVETKTSVVASSVTNDELLNPVLKLDEIVFLIDDDWLLLMVDISSEEDKKGFDTLDFKSAKNAFHVIHEEAFGERYLDKNLWVAISNSAFAYTINETMPESGVCFEESVPIPRQNISEKVGFPHEDTVDCNNSGRDCKQNRSCDIRAKEDKRDCNKCLLRAPKFCAFGGCTGGQCVQRGNDPVCAVARGVQNDLYRLDAEAKRADCKRIKEQDRLICEAEKQIESGLCLAGRETLKRLNRSGNIANVKGNIAGTGQAKVCLTSFTVNDKLTRINSKVNFQGEATLKGNIKLIPLDIAGHLTCQMPANVPINTKVSMSEQQISPTVNMFIARKGEQFGIAYSISEFDVNFKLSPAPTLVLLTSPDLVVKCAGIQALSSFIVTATAFVPELRGDFEHTQSEMKGFIALELPEQKLLGQTTTISLNANDKAVYASPK